MTSGQPEEEQDGGEERKGNKVELEPNEVRGTRQVRTLCHCGPRVIYRTIAIETETSEMP